MNCHASTVDHWLGLCVPGAHLDDDGTACISADEFTVLAIEVPDESEVCYFYAPVGPLSGETPETDLSYALELNRFGRPLGGCWLAWDPELDMLILCHNLHIPSSDAISFGNTVNNFFAALKEAREQLSVSISTP